MREKERHGTKGGKFNSKLSTGNLLLLRVFN
jgi:hypothetical protein